MYDGITNENLGIFVKSKRNSRRWTQHEMAGYSRLSQTTISKIELNKYETNVGPKTIDKILKVFECTAEDVINFDPNNPNGLKAVSSSPHKPFRMNADIRGRADDRMTMAQLSRKRKTPSPRW